MTFVGISVAVVNALPWMRNLWIRLTRLDPESTGTLWMVTCSFRVSGRQPELWNPLDGSARDLTAFIQQDGRTEIPISFDPYGSCFVVFRKQIATDKQGIDTLNTPVLVPVMTLDKEWRVTFDPKWGGPAEITMEKLISWTEHPLDGVKYYSGKAVYHTDFDIDIEKECRYWLDLGNVEDVGFANIVVCRTS